MIFSYCLFIRKNEVHTTYKPDLECPNAARENILIKFHEYVHK